MNRHYYWCRLKSRKKKQNALLVIPLVYKRIEEGRPTFIETHNGITFILSFHFWWNFLEREKKRAQHNIIHHHGVIST